MGLPVASHCFMICGVVRTETSNTEAVLLAFRSSVARAQPREEAMASAIDSPSPRIRHSRYAFGRWIDRTIEISLLVQTELVRQLNSRCSYPTLCFRRERPMNGVCVTTLKKEVTNGCEGQERRTDCSGGLTPRSRGRYEVCEENMERNYRENAENARNERPECRHRCWGRRRRRWDSCGDNRRRRNCSVRNWHWTTSGRHSDWYCCGSWRWGRGDCGGGNGKISHDGSGYPNNNIYRAGI